MADEETGAGIAEEEAKKPEVEGDLEISEEQDQKLPFPTARVVRIIKSNLKKPHQIRSEIKISANVLLGEILADIAKAMDSEETFTLSIEHFNIAARKYRAVDLQQKRIARIKKMLEKQREELEETIMQIELFKQEGE